MDPLFPLRRLHGVLHERRLKSKLKKYLRTPTGQTVYFIGTPEHGNLGDSAIAIAQLSFLNEIFDAERVKELTIREYNSNIDIVKRTINKHCPIVLIGGGNMGDVWLDEEVFRRNVIKDFPDNPIMVFPQTMFYTDTDIGRREKERSVAVYNGRKGLVLVARDGRTYADMKALYPQTRVLFTPDIVLSAPKELLPPSQHRRGVLFCLRSDIEKAVSDIDIAALEAAVCRLGLDFRRTDTGISCAVTKGTRLNEVRGKLSEIGAARLVITDRLHGMIFSAITATPCIVLSNNNHKVEESYRWLESLPYVRFAKNANEAETLIPMLLEIENAVYDSSAFNERFSDLRKVVEGLCLR